MAPHSRFSPVKFYPGGGGSAARRAAPLTGQTMRIDRYKPQEMPPGAGAQTVQALAKVAAAFIEEERDKKDRAAERADQATTVEMMKALRAPQTPFDPAKYGTSPEELRAAAVVMPEGEEDDAWPVPSSEDQREFYTDAAKRTQTAYDQGDPHGADLVIKRHGAGDYNIKDTRDWWDKFIGEDKPEGMAPGARDLMTRILLGDKEKKDAEKLLASKREYERSVAATLAKHKLEVAGAKSYRRTAKVEQAGALFAARRALRDAKSDKDKATAQAVVDSLEFVIKGQDPKSVERLETAKLVPRHTEKGRTAWATFDSKMSPLKAMAHTVKGILYGDGTEEGKERAKSGLEYRSGYSSLVPPLAQTEAARYTQAQLTNLTSQIKQNVLQAYRLMGHTGGAVGQVSDAEQKMFANNITAMEQSQSYEDYVRSLKRIIAFVYGDGTPENIGSMNRLRAAYTKEFGSESSYFPKSDKPKSDKPKSVGDNPSLTDLLKVYGD